MFTNHHTVPGQVEEYWHGRDPAARAGGRDGHSGSPVGDSASAASAVLAHSCPPEDLYLDTITPTPSTRHKQPKAINFQLCFLQRCCNSASTGPLPDTYHPTCDTWPMYPAENTFSRIIITSHPSYPMFF